MFPESAKQLIRSGAYAHLATLNESGSIHVTLAWAGVEDDSIVLATLHDQKKLHNMRRDPRVTVSFEGSTLNRWGLREYLIVKGRATITEGGAPELLQELAHVYLGPDARFPPMPDPPPGFVTHISVDHLGGMGPWMDEVKGSQ
ncbi:MAG TPA: TIGR03618 family F420-dependent PPOX class oxidoreductase [Actinomycetota bacterium]|nr:TIGR03618 family F420-dependent PPOX class oxidoreductase [Actinomycetota bacterium]